MQLKECALQSDNLYTGVGYVRICHKLVQFSTGSLHRHWETFNILNFYETPPRGSNDFLLLGHFSYFYCVCIFTKVNFQNTF